MTNTEKSISTKQLIILALIGLVILVLFAVSFVWSYNHTGVLGDVGEDVVLAIGRFWIFTYLVVTSVYVSYFATRFAKGRRKHAWFWGITGFALTLVCIMSVPSLLSPIFPYQSPVIFAGPAIFAFLAPVLSVLFIMLLISIRRKAMV